MFEQKEWVVEGEALSVGEKTLYPVIEMEVAGINVADHRGVSYVSASPIAIVVVEDTEKYVVPLV